MTGNKNKASKHYPNSTQRYYHRFHRENHINNTKRSRSYQTNLQKEKDRREKEDSGENKVVPSMQEKTWLRFTFFLPLTPLSRRTTYWHQGQTQTQESLGENCGAGYASLQSFSKIPLSKIVPLFTIPNLIGMIPIWFPEILMTQFVEKQGLNNYCFLSKCSPFPSPWTEKWPTWASTLTHPRKVVEGSGVLCHTQQVSYSLLISWWHLHLHMYMVSRVFLKRHFVNNQKAHPITQQGDTQEKHIQKERLNKQV